VDDGGVRFLVRVVSSLQHKEEDKRRHAASPQSRKKQVNPFLPPEPELRVADISKTHIAVLNKFNVLDHHLLIVTREFEDQETLLTPADFRALCACLREYDSLGFYNGGAVAGASQPHKHLQLVPLPFAPEGPAIPVEPLLAGVGPRCPGLPFHHAFGRLASSIAQSPAAAAEETHRLYLQLLAELGIGTEITEGKVTQSAPYNLVIAHDWLLVVPRLRELFRGLSVNALGFVGSLFVKDRAQLELVCAEGPMHVLAEVAGPVTD
jgi:ATP adenylyltransferase